VNAFKNKLSLGALRRFFGSLENVVQPENIAMLVGLSDAEIIAFAGNEIPDVCDTVDHLPHTIKREVWETLCENEPPGETPRAYVTLVNAVHSVRMSYDECLELFPNCTPTWFGLWFASKDLSLTDRKIWLPQEASEEASEEESEGFETCEEAEPDEEP